MRKQKDNSEELLSLYADGPAMLEAALAGLSESGLDQAKVPGEWTIRQIVHHVVDGDDIWKPCLKAALGNSDGLFSLQWYWEKPQTEWAQHWRYASRGIQQSVELLCANRRQILELLQEVPEACQKSIWLKRRSRRKIRIRIVDVLEIQGGHVLEHINEIKLIRKMHNI
jgi:hypothetical protein